MSPSDPLFSTLLALPFAAALAGAAAKLLRTAVSRFELALWAGWVALALHHGRLGLPGSALLVMAFGIALAAGRTLALAPRLVRVSPARPPRAATAAFLATLSFLLFLWPWSRAGRAPDGDEPYYLLLTESLAFDFDVDLADEYRERSWERFSEVPIEPQPGDPTGPHGERWSRHSAFLPLLLAPLRRLAGIAGAELGMILFTAALAAAIFALVRERAGPRAATPVWAIVAVAPPLFLYSGRLWVEVPAALAMALALLALERLRRDGAANRRALALFAGAVAVLPLLKLRFLALAAPLLLLALWRLWRERRATRRAIVLAAGAVLGGFAALALWNLRRFGNPLRMYAAGELDPTAISPAALLRGLSGLGFDSAYGLFAVSPIWLLVAPAFVLALRRRALPLAELLCAAPYLYFIAGRREWYGGWSPPFRYGIVLLPLLALLAAQLFSERRRSAGVRVLLGALAAATAVSALVAALHPAWTFSLADGGSRPLAELSAIYSGDLLRFTPSSVRPRLATWLWPLSLLLAAAAPAFARRSPVAAHAAPLLAAALLPLGFALWLGAAHRVPTRVVEAEDPWVEKRGGGLYPGPWTIDRTRYAGGWNLAPGHALSFAPVAGGDRVAIVLRAESRGEASSALALQLEVGDEIVALFEPPDRAPGEFRELTCAPVAIAPGDRVTVRAVRPNGAPGAPHWIVDRLELDWR